MTKLPYLPTMFATCMSGGPKSEVPYHPGEKKTVGQKKASSGGSHHDYGRPKSAVPHHVGPKKD